MPTTDLAPVEVLRAARALIEDQANWTTGTLVCNATGKMCALGAVSQALGLPPTQYPDDDHPAVVALAAAALEALPAEFRDGYEPEHGECVVELNDREKSSEHHAKVIAMFDRAITLAESE